MAAVGTVVALWPDSRDRKRQKALAHVTPGRLNEE